MKTENRIDKIVLSHGKDRCVVHLENGTTLHFNFYKMGMTYIEGLEYIEGEVLGGPNNWTRPEKQEQYEETIILKVA